MNEELKVMEEIENNEVAMTEYYEEPENTGNGIVGKIAIGAVAAVVGAGAFIYYKTKDKREERTIRKLEKKGYVISKVVDQEVEESEPVSESNEDVQEEK